MTGDGKDLVLVGGGHAHLLLVKRLISEPIGHLAVKLISPEPVGVYSGMVPGVIAGHYARAACEIDLARLCQAAGVEFIQAEVNAIDRNDKTLGLTNGASLPYDLISLDVGSRLQSDGLDDKLIGIKPLGAFLNAWDGFLADLGCGVRSPSACIIGGGAAGIELSFAINHRLKALNYPNRSVHLVQRADTLAPDLPHHQTRRLTRLLKGTGVELKTGCEVKAIEDCRIHLSSGDRIDAALVINATGPRPWSWLAESGLETHDGSICVDSHLMSLTDQNVFAVGDCAHLISSPRAKAGVYAVGAAPTLFANIKARARGRAIHAQYHPRQTHLKLISLGDREALGLYGPASYTGRSIWRLKDQIDRSYVDAINGAVRKAHAAS